MLYFSAEFSQCWVMQLFSFQHFLSLTSASDMMTLTLVVTIAVLLLYADNNKWTQLSLSDFEIYSIWQTNNYDSILIVFTDYSKVFGHIYNNAKREKKLFF